MSDPKSPESSELLVQRILRALDGIAFGSIEIVVHDSRVVQIERKEKLRFVPPTGTDRP